jgi:hypothetical protein
LQSGSNQVASFIAISFHLGKLNLFHFESKALISEFRSSFGNIITLNYSSDGKLLGVGTESDEAFVIEAETNSFLYCLEGHKNFVSSIFFQEQTQNEEDQLDAIGEEQKNLLNSSHLDTITEYNSNTSSNNYLRQSTSTNFGGLGFSAGINYYKQSTRKISNLELLDNLKEEAELLGSMPSFQSRVFNPKGLKRTRSVSTHSNPINNNIYNDNNNFVNNNNNNECKECIIYDIYTAGYDGYLGVWRIEYYYDPESLVLSKQLAELSLNSKDANIVRKVTSPKPTLLSNISEKNVYYTDFVKIQNVPIFTLKMIDNILVLISKRNNTGSSVFVKFFHGMVPSDEPVIGKNIDLNVEKVVSEEAYVSTSGSNNSNVNGRKRLLNVDSNNPEVKQSTGKAKGNGSINFNKSSVNMSVNNNANSASISYYEGREREGKDAKGNNKRGNSRYKETGNASGNGNNNSDSRNFNKSPYKEK